MGPIKLFISYSHKDEDLRVDLVKHLTTLKRQNVIEPWHARDIESGAEWNKEIEQHLNEAQIILLLISKDFIASDFHWDKEMERAMQRHETGEAVVIPILLRSCDWKSAPFGKLQALPKDMQPLNMQPDRDEAFTNIAREIRKQVEKLTGKSFESTTKDKADASDHEPIPLPLSSKKDSKWLNRRRRVVIAASALALALLALPYFTKRTSLTERESGGPAGESIPILSEGKFEDEFNENSPQWTTGWEVLRKEAKKHKCRYRVISGDRIGFFNAADSNGAVYQYRNFKLVMDVQLSDYCADPLQFAAEDQPARSAPTSPFPADRKISWAIRAQDNSNYYLFELTLTPSGQGKHLKLSIRESGTLRQVGSGKELSHVRYDETSAFNIVTEAKDNDFSVTIGVTGSTDEIFEKFADENGKFRAGAIGFPPIADNKLFLQTFRIEGLP